MSNLILLVSGIDLDAGNTMMNKMPTDRQVAFGWEIQETLLSEQLNY